MGVSAANSTGEVSPRLIKPKTTVMVKAGTGKRLVRGEFFVTTKRIIAEVIYDRISHVSWT